MRLKRVYNHDAPAEQWSTRTEVCRECDRGKVVNAEGDGVENCLVCGGDGKMEIAVPPVRGIQVLRAGVVQRFTQNMINGALKEGWLSIDGGCITIKAIDSDLTYRIVRVPGAYCCHCLESVPGGANPKAAAESLAHVAQAHPGEACPDPSNPSGYRMENYYTAVLEMGEPIETAEAAEMDAGVREALAAKTREKYGAVARRDLSPETEG